MKLYEILLPEKTNAGEPTQAALTLWNLKAIEIAGGLTACGQRIGTWRSPEKQLIFDQLQSFTVACSPEQWRILVDAAFEFFPDQEAIFYVELGDAKIEFRPKSAVAA